MCHFIHTCEWLPLEYMLLHVYAYLDLYLCLCEYSLSSIKLQCLIVSCILMHAQKCGVRLSLLAGWVTHGLDSAFLFIDFLGSIADLKLKLHVDRFRW